LLRNLTGDGLLLHNGRFDISNMKPGDTRRVAFTFDVLDTLADNLAKVEVSVVDRDLQVMASEKISIPIAKGGLFINADNKAEVAASSRVTVRDQPLGNARILGVLEPGTRTERLGTFGDFSKVSLGEDRFGFVESSGVSATQGGASKVAFEPLMRRSPPLLEVNPASLSTTSNSIRIEGVATDSDRVLDVFMFVNSRKVFYRSNRKSAELTRVGFAETVALDPGVNVISVVARENEDTATAHTMVVRRDGPNGEALMTPKHADMDDDEEFADE
jgi:carboxyl-terminal processing protease